MAAQASTLLSTGVRHDITINLGMTTQKRKTPGQKTGGFELLHLDSNQGQRD